MELLTFSTAAYRAKGEMRSEGSTTTCPRLSKNSDAVDLLPVDSLTCGDRCPCSGPGASDSPTAGIAEVIPEDKSSVLSPVLVLLILVFVTPAATPPLLSENKEPLSSTLDVRSSNKQGAKWTPPCVSNTNLRWFRSTLAHCNTLVTVTSSMLCKLSDRRGVALLRWPPDGWKDRGC